MSWSSKEISTLCLAQARFQPPAPVLLPATIHRTPHFELAQRPRKSRLSLTLVSVSPSFSVTSCRVVLPACRKSKLTLFHLAGESVGACGGPNRHHQTPLAEKCRHSD